MRYQSWPLRYQQAAASPAVALQRANWQIDVRDILSAIHVPTLVLSRRADPVGPGPAATSRGASPAPGSSSWGGADHTMWLGDVEALVGEIEEFLAGAQHESASDRVLATILFADVERSTEHLVWLGDTA